MNEKRQNWHNRNIDSNTNSMQTVTLTMVPSRFESCAAAHLKQSVMKKKSTTRGSHDLTELGKCEILLYCSFVVL